MPESIHTQIAVIKKDIEYMKTEIADVKRLQYWLLGLFGTLFIALIAIVLGAN